jgi:ribosomal protein S18 acetylase RimI-like enzyme
LTSDGGVRRARRRDLDRVVELWTAISDHHASIEPLFRLRPGAAGEIRKLLAAQLEHDDTAIFVWESQDAAPAALGGLCIVRIDRAPPILGEVEKAEITDLGVIESFRRRGIGRSLVEAASGWIRSRGVERVEVRVATRNPEGQAFWRALGYEDLMDVLHRRL